MRVLIVDDNEINLKLLRTALEAEGISSLSASDGLEALAILKEEKIDAVITDILMPRMDGYTFCRKVRADRRLQKTPLIIYSSTYVSAGDEKMALEVGADKFLRKPTATADILEVLRDLTGRSRPKRTATSRLLPEKEVMKQYNESLVRKLEEKNQELLLQEKILREGEEKYRTLIESIPDVVWRADQKRNTLYISPNVEKIFGYSPQEIYDGGETIWFGRIHPDDLERVKSTYEALFVSGKKFEVEYRIQKKDGRWAWFRDRAARVFERHGSLYADGLFTDITDLRLLSARLESVREEEAIRISRQIHDEMGQALTAMNIDLAWLEDKTKAKDPQIQERIGSMSAMLGETVQLVQRISGELRPRVLDDFGLVAAMEWKTEEFEKRTGVCCTWCAKPDSVHLAPENSAALYRIFQEILTNVARHAKAHQVTIAMKEEDHGLTLEVADDGRGFVAEKFADAKSLGFIGMQERASMAGGAVKVRSAEGKGTTVVVRLPCQEASL